jgi:hypothetical protein
MRVTFEFMTITPGFKPILSSREILARENLACERVIPI